MLRGERLTRQPHQLQCGLVARHEDADLRLEWPYGPRRPALRCVRRRDARDGQHSGPFQGPVRAQDHGGGREVAPTAATRKNRGSRCRSPVLPTTARRRKSRSRGSGHRVGSGTALRASPTTISMSNRARLHYKRVNRQRQRRCLLLISGLNNFYRGCSEFVKNFHSGITRFA